MKSKKHIILLFLVISLTFIGCTEKKNDTVKTFSTNEVKKTTKENSLTYDQYEYLFKYIVNNLKVENFQLKASTIEDNVTIVDKDLTFDKRMYLTLDGNFTGSGIKPTDEQIIFENEKQDNQITIGIFFVNNSLGNDMIGWPTNAGFNNLNVNLSKQTNYMILSYMNSIITIHQSTSNEANPDITEKFARSIIKLLKEFKYTN